MRGKVVAVDEKLTNVKQFLSQKGYQVVSMEQGLNDADAVIVSGMDDDFLGIEDTMTKMPVINAEGLSAQEVLQEIESRLSPL